MSFKDLGLAAKLVDGLDNLGFTTATPIQLKAIPVAITGRDVIGIAQTGTGKTLAFSLPMIQQIAKTKKGGVIILPTRELAMQVEEELMKISRSIGLRTALLIGGASMDRQIKQLKKKPHIIIGTPGRINDHLEQKTLNLSNTGVLVLDEADRMLDMGFAPQINKILKTVPQNRQTMLFSATMPSEIKRIINQYMVNPEYIEIARAGSINDDVDQKLFVVDKPQKNQLLHKLLQDHPGTILVFSRTKHGARKICRAIRDMGYTATELHSNLTQGQRKKSLDGFKSGKFRVLVATDIAARGIDVSNIELVVNYDLPESPDDYVHRIGRTGRAGNKGIAISFADRNQGNLVRGIERSIQQALPQSQLPNDLPAAIATRGRDAYQIKEKRFSNNHRRSTFTYTSKKSNKPQNRRTKTRSTGQPKVRFHF